MTAFLLGTSWKMHKTRADAALWVETLLASGLVPPGTAGPGTTPHGTEAPAAAPARGALALFVMPPFTAIETTLAALGNGARIAVGAQNVHEAPAGAFTGEVSAAMLAELGCTLVELGHSERRRLFAESDAAVAAKVRAVLDHGMRPLVCVGDTREEHDADATVDSVLRQATIALSRADVVERERCLLAYEPLWAIGAGAEAAPAAHVARVHAALKRRFADTPVLYGGSVDAANAGALARLEAVDGLFVGRAALAAKGFVAIGRAVVAALGERA